MKLFIALILIISNPIHNAITSDLYKKNNLCESFTYKDTAFVEKKILEFKYKKYVSKSIGNFLDKIDIKEARIIFIKMKPRYLAFVSIKLPGGYWVDIYTKKYKFLKRYFEEGEDEDAIWGIEQLLKEKIDKIRLRKGSTILKEFPRNPELPIV